MSFPNFNRLLSTDSGSHQNPGDFVVLNSPTHGFCFYAVDSPFLFDSTTAAIEYRRSSPLPFEVTIIAYRESPATLCPVVARFQIENEARLFVDTETQRAIETQRESQRAFEQRNAAASPGTLSSGNSSLEDNIVEILKELKEQKRRQDGFRKCFELRMATMERGFATIVKHFDDTVSELKKQKAGEARHQLRRKPHRQGQTEASLLIDGGQDDLNAQIHAFATSPEGRALNVTLDGHNFYEDVLLLKPGVLVKKARKLGMLVFQLVMDVKHLKYWSVGNLLTGRLSISSNRRAQPKDLFNSEFNRVIGNIAMLAGGGIIDDGDRQWYFNDMRSGLNGRGDTMYSSNSVERPDLSYLRVGGYTPPFDDPSHFLAPSPKRQLVENPPSQLIEDPPLELIEDPPLELFENPQSDNE